MHFAWYEIKQIYNHCTKECVDDYWFKDVNIDRVEFPRYLLTVGSDFKLSYRELTEEEIDSFYEIKLEPIVRPHRRKHRRVDPDEPIRNLWSKRDKWLRNLTSDAMFSWLFVKPKEEISMKIETAPAEWWKFGVERGHKKPLTLKDEFYSEYITVIGEQIVFKKISDRDRLYDYYSCDPRFYMNIPYEWLRFYLSKRFKLDYKLGTPVKQRPEIVIENCDLEVKTLKYRMPYDSKPRTSEKFSKETEQSQISDGKYLVSYGDKKILVRKLTKGEEETYKKSDEEFFKLMRPILTSHGMYWRKYLVLDKQPQIYEIDDTDDPSIMKKYQWSKFGNCVKAILDDGRILNITISDEVKLFIREFYHNNYEDKDLPHDYATFICDWFIYNGQTEIAKKIIIALPYHEWPEYNNVQQ